MYRKSAVPCERLFISSGYIVNKSRLQLDTNNVHILVCWRSWLSVDIWV